MKVALIHEWLTVIGGSEKVFKEIYSLYPGADVFTLVADPGTLRIMSIDPDRVKTSFIQKLPFAIKKYKSYLPLFPYAIEQFDLSSYDLIISSSHAVAKGVLTHSNQTHICYCHSPARYAWDLYHQYLQETGLNNGFRGLIAKYFLHRIRIWDVISSNRVDFFISNSDYIGKRIKKIYGRESKTIHPNVAVDDFELHELKEDFYFTCSRFVPYKKIDLIVKAFNNMPEKTLIIIGDGPDFKKVKKLANRNVRLLGYQPFPILKDHLKRAKAFIFAAEEDFGIVPVEAQACGTPVIAYGKGGVLETVLDKETGLFFYSQSEIAIENAVRDFEMIKFNSRVIYDHAQKYSIQRFKNELLDFIEDVKK